MWLIGGPIPLVFSFSLKFPTSWGSSAEYLQPRGLRVKTWKVSQFDSLALSTAKSIVPAMLTWSPTFTLSRFWEFPLWVESFR